MQVEQKEESTQKKEVKNGRKKRVDVTAILLTVAIIVAVISSLACLSMIHMNRMSANEYEEISADFTTDGDDAPVTGDGSADSTGDKAGGTADAVTTVNSIPKAPSVDFEGLRAKGHDIVAWISIPYLDINYPIVHTDDNEDYLHRTAYGNRFYAGSIILEAINSPSFTDVNTILYGHNMSAGSMFGKLLSLHEDTPKEPVYIWICTPTADYLYRVFSEYVTDMHSDAYRMFGTKDTSADAAKWISEISGKSKAPFKMPPTYIKRVLTLSTCTSASDNTRRVVHAVMMKRQVKTNQ